MPKEDCISRERGDLTRLGKRFKERLFPGEAYPPYRPGRRKKLLYGGIGAVLALALGLLFFGNGLTALLILPGILLGIARGSRRLGLVRRQELRVQLKDYLLAVMGLMRSGYALENAMQLAEAEMKTVHGETAVMSLEALRMSRELRLQQAPEAVFRDFAERTGLQEGAQLAEVLRVAKRQGGGAQEVLKTMAEAMESREMLCREIDTLLAGQKLEYRIMCLVPAGILLYLKLCAPELTASLAAPGGRVFMGAALLFYLGCFLLGERILESCYGR